MKIAISIGDINGIGPELILRTFSDTRLLQNITPVIYGSSKVITYYRKALELNEFNFNQVKSIQDAIARKVNVINCWEEEVKIEPGQANAAGGKYALAALEAATSDLIRNKAEALVTAPLNKHLVAQTGLVFTGHTEFIAEKCGASSYLMLMVSDQLRVATVTGHIPLREVVPAISGGKIYQKLKILHESLKKDFGIGKPRIAVLGLNPHASDSGLIGNEEKSLIEPEIKKAFQENIFVYGPYSPDGFFGTAMFKKFDAVLAMYHDQGLIPFKTLAFSTGVNFTAGLPVIRTSPDHGPAYEIAGKNKADENSFREAVYLAQDLVRKRQEFQQITANPLPFSKLSSDQ